MDFIFYAVIAAALGLIVLIVLATNYTSEGKGFDEMQLIKRGDAFRAGFFTLLGCVFMLMILENWKTWTENVTLMFSCVAIVMVSLVVFGVYCIAHDAFFRMRESKKFYLGICFCVVFANSMQAVTYFLDKKTLLENGKVSISPCGNLLIAGTFLILAIAIVVKMFAAKKEEKDEES
ncbi:MAG: hypothetical protein J6S78_05145 [Lachnospiraceae bacterium]|nr:hypothetical protein [Lachnospiraceae bacterium]